MRKIKPLLFPLIALLLIGSGAAGYFVWNKKQEEAKRSQLPASLIATADKRDIESRLPLTGDVAPAFSVEVKSEISGRIESIHVNTGETVSRGGPLITIDDKDLLTEKSAALTEIDGARIEVEKRKGNYERAKALFEEKLISKEVYANLEADWRIAENNLIKAHSRLQTVEDRLSKTRILAPADGTVLTVNVNEGQVVVGATSVNAGTVLLTFADLSRLEINTHINQMDIGKIKVGDVLKVKVQGADVPLIPARVTFIAPVATVKNNIKGFAVEAVIEEKHEALRPGMSVSMHLPLGKADDAVSVPIAAVFADDDGEKYVYVRQGNRNERRSVTLGVTNFSFAEIKSGLKPGEEILLVEPKNLPEPHS